MTTTETGASARYGAFISYNHADRARARWLHRALERYRIPAKLVGGEAAFGPVPRRLGRIFRDLDELSAASDLSAEVRAALAESACLIVICTPAAAASQWVAREIALFRELHPDRPVLAALFDGEPAEALPLPLRRTAEGAETEPLAADFREGKDGRRLALLKLVAGAVGVPLDALVQRDAQARVRRVTAVTALAVCLLLAMAGLTILAVRARGEAEARRAQAEGLVEFMLTDLRDRLKEVGRLDVLRAANERALRYYGEQDLATLPPDMLARRARALMTMGEDALEAKDVARARTAFVEANRVTGALVARSPNVYDLVFAHAQSEYYLGLLHFNANDLVSAETHFEAYAALAHRLMAINSADRRSAEEIAYSAGNLCSLRMAQRAVKPAVKLCAEALYAAEAVVRRNPDDNTLWLEVANRQGWLADAERQAGDVGALLKLRREQVALLDRMVSADPRNARNRRLRVWAERALAKAEARAGNGGEGVARMRHAISELRTMTGMDTENQELATKLHEMEAEMADMRRGKL
ncbi:MTH538 TIR-like domain [Sphingomonas sp. NFR04]|uniref:toll/interleukin-1 receptor domain-containing protein n=1 Tax=Sphingomonas sp. NFR04 TaxID=1566283 RepID=UPI0008F01201|nr:toll/interleukin-1 receptor domain-containing protein [Sphingomonas sp. NFR04]SFJ77899.1 MTH538 TIR-like domain [Sphingomonas sp. NFR04]